MDIESKIEKYLNLEEEIARLHKAIRKDHLDQLREQGIVTGGEFNLHYYDKKIRVKIFRISVCHHNPYKTFITADRLKLNGQTYRRHHGYKFETKKFIDSIIKSHEVKS